MKRTSQIDTCIPKLKDAAGAIEMLPDYIELAGPQEVVATGTDAIPIENPELKSMSKSMPKTSLYPTRPVKNRP
jgi:hypothetical protein